MGAISHLEIGHWSLDRIPVRLDTATASRVALGDFGARPGRPGEGGRMRTIGDTLTPLQSGVTPARQPSRPGGSAYP